MNAGDNLETEEIDKAEELNPFLTSVFTGKACSLTSMSIGTVREEEKG